MVEKRIAPVQETGHAAGTNVTGDAAAAIQVDPSIWPARERRNGEETVEIVERDSGGHDYPGDEVPRFSSWLIRITRSSLPVCFNPCELPARVRIAVPGSTSKLLPSIVITPRPLST